jgi:YspA, cpYpsA-related SLOG family
MKVIIAGGRDYENYDVLIDAVKESLFEITTVVSGGANGVDALGKRYAFENKKELDVHEANWKAHGRGAGPARNKKMAENAEALIAIWDGQSKGTKNMIDTATKKGLLVFVKRVEPS